MRLFLVAAFAGLSAIASAQPATIIMPSDPRAVAVHEQYGYADAVVAGQSIYLSGIPVGLAPGETDMVPAFEHAFRRIEHILAKAGAKLDDIVEITSFHTEVGPQVEAMAKAKKLHMTRMPAWTAVGTTGLLEPTAISEIKIVAYLAEKPRQ